MATMCSGCNEGFSNGDIIAVCSVCHDLFHANEGNGKNCSATTASKIRVLKLRTKPLLVYRCKVCTENGGDSPKLIEAIVDLQMSIQKLTSISESLENLSNVVIPKMRQDICEVQDSNMALKTCLDNHVLNYSEEMRSVKLQFNELQNKIITQGNASSSTSSLPIATSSSTQMVLNEIEDRKKRERNLIIRNVPENIDVSVRNHDLNCVINILSKINNINTKLDDKKIYRLGVYNPNKIRPILVKMDTHQDVTNVLIHWKLIPNQYFVSGDLTPCQREHLNKLRAEVREFNANNAKNNNLKKIVKFIKGNATILTIKNNKFEKINTNIDSNGSNSETSEDYSKNV